MVYVDSGHLNRTLNQSLCQNHAYNEFQAHRLNKNVYANNKTTEIEKLMSIAVLILIQRYYLLFYEIKHIENNSEIIIMRSSDYPRIPKLITHYVISCIYP